MAPQPPGNRMGTKPGVVVPFLGLWPPQGQSNHQQVGGSVWESNPISTSRKSLNQITTWRDFGSTWVQNRGNFLSRRVQNRSDFFDCLTVRVAYNVTVNAERYPGVRMTELSLRNCRRSSAV